MIKLEPSFADQKHYWDERWDQHPGPNAYQFERGQKVLEWVRSLGLSKPEILDLGCATGWFTDWLREIGPATGVDLSPHAIEIAKERFPHGRYMAGNFYELPFPPNHFDVIVNQEVIPHVPDQYAFLERIAYILKPGGYLVITAANRFVMERVDAAPDPDSHIKKWLGMKELKDLLRQWFRVLRSTSVIPMGDRGILRFVNSYKVNSAFQLIFSEKRLKGWKEQANLGYSLIVLAQKK